MEEKMSVQFLKTTFVVAGENMGPSKLQRSKS